MKKEGFTDAEFAKLTEAQKNSDGLVVAETIAMNAVKGLFDEGMGILQSKKHPIVRWRSNWYLMRRTTRTKPTS